MDGTSSAAPDPQGVAVTGPPAEPRSLHVAGDESSLPALVRRSALPVWLLGLPTGRIIEVSDAIADLFRVRRDQLLHRHVTDFAGDQAVARSRLRLLSAGHLDSYRVQARTYTRPDGSAVDVDACISACTDESPRRVAVGVLLPVDQSRRPISAAPVTSGLVAMGTVDQEWRIDRISAGIEPLLGHKSATVVGEAISDLVLPEEWPSLVIAIGHGLRHHGGATTRLALRAADGEPMPCTVHITPLAGAGAPGFAFSFAVADRIVPDVADRAWELEAHMRRIAREVEASGVLEGLTGTPTATTVPAMAGLTTRELEVVTRLLAGDRVATMAQRMFLSQSTLRNHLTSVYRKLGVRSQLELLTLLRVDARTGADPGNSTRGADHETRK
ncbi:MAG: Response regulator containing a CheY-like receiver domain and an DNA-binding domain [Frankiales bacterium]|nr:Response regulator containing a CheY-like receiver domain and an DNA-binding domain [Frankiales bacterium]